MSRVEEEAVTRNPHRVGRVINEIFCIESVGKIGSTHRASGMPRLCNFNHRSRQDANVVGCLIQ